MVEKYFEVLQNIAHSLLQKCTPGVCQAATALLKEQRALSGNKKSG